ncbi:MAG: hypothetical protein DRG36_02905 [Deltaproteobacteria bacterium]|nr:MAG: hypothetical protein DRG36_02905 [Deltaproteobacteria bacterium]
MSGFEEDVSGGGKAPGEGVLEQQGGNVSKTARILGISRKTVRRAREGPLRIYPGDPGVHQIG